MSNWFTEKMCESSGNKCSCFVDRAFGKDWSSCCSNHDDCYDFLESGQSTKECDVEFLTCLKTKTWKWLAYSMYGMVRVFGRNFK